MRRKLNLRTWARIKVLSELGMAAGIIMASDGLSGSMLFTASQLGAVVHGIAAWRVHSIARTHSRHRPGWGTSRQAGAVRPHAALAQQPPASRLALPAFLGSTAGTVPPSRPGGKRGQDSLR